MVFFCLHAFCGICVANQWQSPLPSHVNSVSIKQQTQGPVSPLVCQSPVCDAEKHKRAICRCSKFWPLDNSLFWIILVVPLKISVLLVVLEFTVLVVGHSNFETTLFLIIHNSFEGTKLTSSFWNKTLPRVIDEKNIPFKYSFLISFSNNWEILWLTLHCLTSLE